ncbi:hypothetical protein GCM10009560_67090 [Nonomuraea longicatena]|uniref:Uncharacterized protein n=1 Tax=Nonomuraea longicatena TaxID=83682 RepID=A0ABN1QY55_9ACTN
MGVRRPGVEAAGVGDARAAYDRGVAVERVWTVAWWRDGWGVWPGEDPDLGRSPAYSTVNITRAASEAASHWALGVVPPGRVRIRCRFGGDPDGAARFAVRSRSRRWWGR